MPRVLNRKGLLVANKNDVKLIRTSGPPSWLTRRGIFGACASFFPWVGAAAAQKKPKTQVAYQNRPKGISSCATCSFFQAPKSCALVEGVVSPNGWCKLYAALD
jgi:hypothetical protein